MKMMSDKEIKRSLANVKTTLEIEGLKLNRRTVYYGRRYLKGEMSSEQAIDNITRYILSKSGRRK